MTFPLVAEFFVQGEPRPQGSKTPVKRGNRVILIDGKGAAPAKLKAWRSAVANAARTYMEAHGVEEIDYPIRVEVSFHILKPKSTHKKVLGVAVNPDLDKLFRAVGDGLTTSKKEPDCLLKDDSRIVELEASKYYVTDESQQGVTVKIFDIRSKAIVDPQAQLFS